MIVLMYVFFAVCRLIGWIVLLETAPHLAPPVLVHWSIRAPWAAAAALAVDAAAWPLPVLARALVAILALLRRPGGV